MVDRPRFSPHTNKCKLELFPLLRKTQFYFIYIKQQQGFRIDNRGVNHRKSEPKILFKKYSVHQKSIMSGFRDASTRMQTKIPRADGIAPLPRDKRP